jgi:Carboxypeptidase regulatory-like domain
MPFLLALLVLTLAAQTSLAQQAPVVLRGQVADAENARPLRRAIVSLARGDRRVRPVLTDQEGRFAIELPDLSSAVVITKAGYASALIEPDRRTVPLRELDVPLSRGAAMSGRVIERGMPAIRSRVIARRVEDTSKSPPTYEADTDDQGEYRIGGLPSGRYIVSAAPIPQGLRITDDRDPVQGIVSRSVPVFPGMTPGLTSSTRLVEVPAGEETGEVDFEAAPLDMGFSRVPGAAPALVTINEQEGGTISGRVVTPSGQPVGGAIVAISGNNQLRMLTADVDGQFEAGRFRDGEYQIETGKSGYLMALTMDSGTARTVRVGGDTRVLNIELVLSRGGAVAGTIVDSAGEPFQGVLVRALRLRHDGGSTLASLAASPRLTDDRGRYRVFGLPPGSYLIVASLDATEPTASRSRPPGFAPMYYPGTAHVESAQAVQVDLANAVAGIDLTFAASSTVRVSGTVVNAAGNPVVGRVTLRVAQRSGSVMPDPRLAPIESDGSFELADIPPGDYVLQAVGERALGNPAEFASEYVTVAETDSPPLTIKTSVGATLDGRFVADGQASLPMRAQVIHASPIDVDRSPPGGRGPEGLAVYDDGRFYLTGLYGPMRLTYPAPSGWYLKSVTIGGVDVTDQPFDFGFGDDIFPDAQIALSTSGARIAGSMVNGSGKPVTATAVAFSVNRANWFIGSRHVKRSTADANGSFDVNGLPPGEYFVAAVDVVGPGDWQAPDALEALVSRATRVTVREGQVRTLDLRLTRR